MSFEAPSGSVVVTPEMMYEEIRRNSDAMRDVKGLLDPALKEIRRDIIDNKKLTDANHADHEIRLRWVEKKIWIAVGGTGVISTLLSFAIAWGMKK